MIDFFTIYLIIYLSIFLHEMMHYLIAKFCKFEIDEVKIGSEWPQFKLGKWRISPFLGVSYVAIKYESFIEKSLKSKCLYFLGGIFMNIFLSVLCLIIYIITDRYMLFLAFFVNLYSVIANSIPIGKTDAMNLLKEVRNSKI